MDSRKTRRKRAGWRLSPWWRPVLALGGALLLVAAAIGLVGYGTLSDELDAVLADGWSTPPAVLKAAPLELRIGQALGPDDLARWLGQLGYTRQDKARGMGQFAVQTNAITLVELDGASRGRRLGIHFAGAPTPRISRIVEAPGRHLTVVSMTAPILSTFDHTERRKRRVVPLNAIPPHVVQAVMAAEDHRFFSHAGVDPVRMVGAALTNLFGNRTYLVGASTLTQQLVKNRMLTPAQTFERKLREQALALLLERRRSKAELLELYLNNVYLGQRDTFAIHGVAQGARTLFGKDLRNLTLGEAATMAGIIAAPATHAPAREPERARQRRNLVLQGMVELDYIAPEAALRAAREPIASPPPQTEDLEAPYFVDLVSRELATTTEPGAGPRVVETTLDVRLQQLAEVALKEGLDRIRTDERAAPDAQAALVAVDPRTGAIRALVGGDSYERTQFNRATRARRQPGSIIKPFVYLAALERARRDPSFTFSPETLIDDSPSTFVFDDRRWRPANYGDVYDGPVSARLALARSRNVAAVKVARDAGFDTVAALWAAAAHSAVPPAYPALALGVFEASPLEVATAYALLANGGISVPLRTVAPTAAVANASDAVVAPGNAALIADMLRDTFEVGTATSARDAGFTHPAAGKTGTTDELRDAWFAGFTGDLLAVAWVGVDDGGSLGLTGAEAALPIWTAFMQAALDTPAPGRSRDPGIIE